MPYQPFFLRKESSVEYSCGKSITMLKYSSMPIHSEWNVLLSRKPIDTT